MSVEEFVETAEQIGDNPKSENAYRKIYEQIMKDKMENEYNRTKVEDRHGSLTSQKDKKEAFTHNRLFTPRIFESFDAKSHHQRGSYLN